MITQMDIRQSPTEKTKPAALEAVKGGIAHLEFLKFYRCLWRLVVRPNQAGLALANVTCDKLDVPVGFACILRLASSSDRRNFQHLEQF